MITNCAWIEYLLKSGRLKLERLDGVSNAYKESMILKAHNNSFSTWYYRLANCHYRHFNAVFTVYRAAFGVQVVDVSPKPSLSHLKTHSEQASPDTNTPQKPVSD